MRFSFVPFLEVNLGVVVSLFLLRVAFPRLIGLPVRSMIGLLAWIIFRCLFSHGIPLACMKLSDEQASGSSPDCMSNLGTGTEALPIGQSIEATA